MGLSHENETSLTFYVSVLLNTHTHTNIMKEEEEKKGKKKIMMCTPQSSVVFWYGDIISLFILQHISFT